MVVFVLEPMKFWPDEFQFTWINSDMLCICCSVNGDQVTLLTSSIKKNIWKELLLSCLRDKAKIALFSKLSKFYFGLRHPGQDRSENWPLGQLECAKPWGLPGGGGGGQAWNCLIHKGYKRSSTPQLELYLQPTINIFIEIKILWQNSKKSMYTYKMTGPIVCCYNNKIHWKILIVSCPLFSVSWSLLAIN